MEASSAGTKKDTDSSKYKDPSMCKKAVKLQTRPFLTEKEVRAQNQNLGGWSQEPQKIVSGKQDWALTNQVSGNMLLAGFQNCYGSVTAIRLSFLPSLKENFSEIILSLYHIICCTCVGMGQTMGPFISQVFRLRGIILRELLRDLHLNRNLIYVIKSWSSSLG